MGKKQNFYTKQKEIQIEKAAQRKQQERQEPLRSYNQEEAEVPNPQSQSNSYNMKSHFQKLTTSELEVLKLESLKPLNLQPVQDVLGSVPADSIKDSSDDLLGIPIRPPFSLKDTKDELEEREMTYFADWRRKILKEGGESLSYFEQNLEVWRQLWRVVEMSDILLVIVDVRNPLLHLPPSLYRYIVLDCRKKMIIVLNKTDLVPADTVQDWETYLTSTYPGISVSRFSCNPTFEDNEEIQSLLSKNKIKAKSFKRYYRASGVLDIIRKCAEIAPIKKQAEIDWSGLEERIKRDLEERETKAVDAIRRAVAGRGGIRNDKSSKARRRRQIEAELEDAVQDGNSGGDEDSESDGEGEDDDPIPDADDPSQDKSYVTLGTIGEPNVGKSSILNSLFGKKCVSVSKSPGHTKHFQTLILAPHLRLCDCPGLVFPSTARKEVQIISGVYSVAQVQDPVSVVKYIAERIDLVSQLHLKHPEKEHAEEEEEKKWSAWDICEAFATLKGFRTAKAGRPDIHRAANLILRMIAEGRLQFFFTPPTHS